MQFVSLIYQEASTRANNFSASITAKSWENWLFCACAGACVCVCMCACLPACLRACVRAFLAVPVVDM